VPALVQALSDPVLMVRRWAASALGEIGPRAAEAAPALVEVFRDPSVASRAVAMAALCRLGPEAALALLPALDDDDPQVRRHAVVTLGKCDGNPDELLGEVEQAARDPDPSVRAAAIDAWEAIVLRRAAADDPDLID
jgi:HEAT repeat protein